MNFAYLFLAVCFSGQAANIEDYQWSKRVVRCQASLVKDQEKELNSNVSMKNELKLVSWKAKTISGCELIGLDGGVKHRSSKVFKLKKLESLINQMPMRKSELKNKAKN